MGDVINVMMPGRKPDPMGFTIEFRETGPKAWDIKVHEYYKPNTPPLEVYHEVAMKLFDIAAGMLQVGQADKTIEQTVIATIVLFSDGSAKISSLPTDSEGKRKMMKKMMKAATKEILGP